MIKINPKLILETIYPVGSIYINTTGTNPSTFLGGTWEAFGKGRVLVGQDTGDTSFDTLGETGGDKAVTLKIEEMPAHKHDAFYQEVANFVHGDGMYNGLRFAQGNGVTSTGQIGETRNTGGGQAHNNLQPYIVVSMWQRTA